MLWAALSIVATLLLAAAYFILGAQVVLNDHSTENVGDDFSDAEEGCFSVGSSFGESGEDLGASAVAETGSTRFAPRTPTGFGPAGNDPARGGAA